MSNINLPKLLKDRSLPPSSSSSSSEFTYDVFLSFRGSDTRYNFTGNLYGALSDKRIRTFMDDRELKGGEEITPSLLNAIEKSKILIPVFSKNYAGSSFCLDELVHIIKCSDIKGRLVLPIFYEMDPSHVRHQTGNYSEGLTRLEKRIKNNMERLQKWKKALNRAVDFSGGHFNPKNQYEYKFIKGIVKYVSCKINHAPLNVSDNPVGLESRVQKVKSLLDKTRMLGIYGRQGTGKTVIAKAVYNCIVDQFESSCFLHNVRENVARHGLKHLQEVLLSRTVGLDFKLEDVSEGIPIINQRIKGNKVLLIINDVDELEQLQVLVGGDDLFGRGNKVIITTRSEQLLEHYGVKTRYKVEELTGKERSGLSQAMALGIIKREKCNS